MRPLALGCAFGAMTGAFAGALAGGGHWAGVAFLMAMALAGVTFALLSLGDGG